MSYSEWQAAIAAGATLTELLEWETTHKFPLWFKARVLAWHRMSNLISLHSQNAVQRASEKKKR